MSEQQDKAGLTETERLARTIRFIILGAVAIVATAVAIVALWAGISWGWDAATTTHEERIQACMRDASMEELGFGYFDVQKLCKEGEFEKARATGEEAKREEIERDRKWAECEKAFEAWGYRTYADVELFSFDHCN